MDFIEVNDLYHASYLLMNGMSIEEVKSIPVSGVASCSLKFSGQGIQELSEEFLTKKACANLFAFRQAYQQITNYVHQARRNAKKNSQNGKGVVS
jgi:hypothetical protein